MFNVDRVEAGMYVAIWYFWTWAFSAWEWWAIDWEITREHDHYTCVAWGINFESYRSLKLTMKFLDDFTNLLVEYEKKVNGENEQQDSK